MLKISQTFPRMGIKDVKSAVINALASSDLKQKVQPGMKVGITAGSRGINNIPLILREVVSYVKSLGANPILLAAMGSHGGGNPEGQREILKSLGISEESVGAPVICSTDCTEVGRAFYGEVFINSKALECDALILINRIKPHTSFHGDYESGLLKMLVVGLGGPLGAASFHKCQPQFLSKAVAEGAKIALQAVSIASSLAILEDAYDETRKLVSISTEELYEVECKLSNEARKYLPGLPTQDLDILIVDKIGKNYSGTGIDTNVVGRLRIQGSPEPESPKIKRIVVLDVAPEAHGNAYGIGLADFTTARLVDKIDRRTVYLNALTSTFVQRAMIPMTCPNDYGAIVSALRSLGSVNASEARVIRIHNTLHLNEMLVSENVFHEIKDLPIIQRMSPPQEIKFDREGNLLPF